MLISEKIITREFIARTQKDAYLKCCKWLSTNIIAKTNSKYITYRIEKAKLDDWNKKIVLTVYVTADEEEIQVRHCEICKEVTGSFFMKQNKHMCDSCKMPPYRRRMKERLDLLKEGLKGVIL